MDQVKKAVTAKYNTQHPQLEGPGEDQLVFGTKSLPPLPYVPVKKDTDRTVTLLAGQVHGVTEGSVYDVYPPGTKSFGRDLKPIAQITIIEVETTSSRAKISKGGPVPDESRAVEREHHWPDPILRIHFMFEDPETKKPGPSPTLQKVREELSGFKHITSVPTASNYDLLLREKHEPKTGKRYIITEGGDPTEISPRVPVEEPEAVDRVVEQVTQWAKWYNILNIKNANSEFKIDVELKPHGSAAGRGQLPDKEVNLALPPEEKFTIEITNRSPKDVYIALLDLCSDGSVSLIFPTGGEQELIEHGRTLGKTLRTNLPDGKDSIRDVLKVIATNSYADFRFLKQSAVRGGQTLGDTRGKAGNPLEELLAGATMGSTRSGVKLVEVGNWSTVDRVLEVRSKK
jgi:hypothetical protein